MIKIEPVRVTVFFLLSTFLSACGGGNGGSSGGETPVTDTQAPTLSAGQPSGTLDAGTTTANLNVTSNENATCKYGDSANTAFTSIANTFSSTGNTSHSSQLTELTDGSSYSYYVRCEDNSNNANNSDYVINFSVADSADVTAPVLSNGTPDQRLPMGTTSTTLSLDTDESAVCKYDVNAGTAYSAMSNSFDSSGSTSHSTSVTGLNNGGPFSYYVRCEDLTGNINDSDYLIRFYVDNGIDSIAPVISDSTPNQTLPINTMSTLLRLDTDERAACKYDLNAGTVYSSMSNSFSSRSGGTSHSIRVSELYNGGSFAYYVRCEDFAGNVNDVDHLIAFDVVEGPPLLSKMPNHPLPMGTTSTNFIVQTNEPGVCKYDVNANTAYSAMTGSFDTTDGINHSTLLTSLEASKSYLYYIRCEDTLGHISTRDHVVNFTVLSAVATDTPWSYVGIPYTDWAYNPFTIQPTVPTEWPAAPAQDYYYVEPDHPQASDTTEVGELTGTYGRFGYPDRPRVSIPKNSWIADVYTAGTVIWLKGGTHQYSWSPQFHGTPDNPIWFYGDPTDKPTFTNTYLRMYNSRYVILDNLQWIGGNTGNGAIGLTRDRAGPTHHITLRNLHFENLNWIGGGGAIISIVAGGDRGNEVHDVVAYKNTFKNNGGGFNWYEDDGDHHGYKIDGAAPTAGNKANRIWIIENRAVKGDFPDPTDGLFKSISGNLVQVGDQVELSGGSHHVYVAGNYQEFARQALGWTKRSHDVIFTSNDCTDTYNVAGGNGQCYGHQYAADHNWWINNVSTKSASGWMHTSNDAMDGKLFIIGNIFHGNNKSDRNDNWRTCSGASLYTQQGEHYFVNNVFDNSCYGIWAQTNRHRTVDRLHIYNNIFTNFSAVVDTRAKAIALEVTNGLQVFMENNLFGSYDGDVLVGGGPQLSLLSDLNNQPWAMNNIVGDPLYIDQTNANYNIGEGSAAVNVGTQTYGSGAEDVYQQFINRYTNDINYPGNPADYWPKDYLNQPRIVGGTIDIGAFERQ